MRVLIIGASGLVGRALTNALIDTPKLQGESIEQLLLLDQAVTSYPNLDWVKAYTGDVSDTALLRRILADGIDVVFHLASVPGGLAEQDYDLGYRVNLQGTLELLNQLQQQVHCPTLIYTSSIAVYGVDLPQSMDEDYLPHPQLSYGAHKLMVETLIRDLSRRGDINGQALRLPGIVARPSQASGLKSAFMSDLMHALAEGHSYECPVSADATAWWMSVKCCVDNLLHATELNPQTQHSIWQLPILHLSIRQVISALCHVYDQDPALVSFNPDTNLEALFGQYPPIMTSRAEQAGFMHDVDAITLVTRALQPI
ncbi:NAD-dependent epimerase/dehydratase family protein [Aestuariicella hydrocarbonica]|uniref:NAD-dependent epimerase/dehydratase family protein n=1 Tax=Pseudomaricurvus hydrocarbonicus TaxID=1470433 RepID=A0A9E5MNB7_9GAMM|nr:NAD-dependent epimerase/dehydratase family protein [Aestuariicella hydrocarbonica]NHO67373.1 NAD-dependent epimerase/dehydratase family protein [Aestuariicella hydrocarbonica]